MRLLKKLTSYFFTSLDTIRYWEWSYIANLHTTIALLIFAFSSILIQEHALLIGLYILYIHIALAFGFLLNNESDENADLQVGKRYLLLPEKQRILLRFFLFSYLIGLPMYLNTIAIGVITIVGLVLGVGYSIPPLRFKERGFLGVFVPVIAQQLPILFLYVLFPNVRELILYLFLWLILSGLLIELEQQIKDTANDSTTNIKTFATQKNTYHLKKLIYIFTSIYIGLTFLPFFTLTSHGILLTLILVTLGGIPIRHAQKALERLKYN